MTPPASYFALQAVRTYLGIGAEGTAGVFEARVGFTQEWLRTCVDLCFPRTNAACLYQNIVQNTGVIDKVGASPLP